MSSILRAENEADQKTGAEALSHQTLVDLNLHRAVADITAGKTEYCLEPLYALPLTTPDEVLFRQEVFRDLENPRLSQGLNAFARQLWAVRRNQALGRAASYPKEQHRWYLDSVTDYCEALKGLARTLAEAPLVSAGLKGFRDWLGSYRESEPFRQLSARQEALQQELGAIRFCILLDPPDIQVRPWQEEEELEGPVYNLFEKFRQGTSRNYLKDYQGSGAMNHLEAQILDRVALMHPETFSRLESFCASAQDCIDPGIKTFDREIQFYLAYQDYLAPLRQAGLPLCYPLVYPLVYPLAYPLAGEPSSSCRQQASLQGDHQAGDLPRSKPEEPPRIICRGLYDPVLARELIDQGMKPVENDLSLSPEEQVLVVTGPNQGGKTTFARALGQQFHLAALGCPVPGREARFPLSPRVLTHFGKEENLQELRSALEDDLHRLEEILDQTQPGSVVVLNEIFSSTTLEDALELSRHVLEELRARRALTVMVTFLDDLAEETPGLVSLVAGIDPSDQGSRTFRVIRAPADGRSYAAAVAARYGLTYEQLCQRIGS
ncbi:MutS domain V [Alkalispirochaeta americana]|uniref:MutS domain V n=1 Tax=Alkalispirochaeta americana TaxID=159291 RepID=A0A1N6N714_9SPIO|nr:hypothetical protein [Alkalispirochaeta americana]SIP87884.1 MutS domain V [Alkalispirochaeta americana]